MCAFVFCAPTDWQLRENGDFFCSLVFPNRWNYERHMMMAPLIFVAAAIECCPCFPKFLLALGVQIHWPNYTRQPVWAGWLAPLHPKHVSLVWDTEEPRGGESPSAEMQVTSSLANCTLVSPEGINFFFFLRRRNAETEFHLTIARRAIFMNFYHMSTHNFYLSLTEGKNLRNVYGSLVNVESLIREGDFFKGIWVIGKSDTFCDLLRTLP